MKKFSKYVGMGTHKDTIAGASAARSNPNRLRQPLERMPK